jgi:hypothetical protein
MEYHSLSHIASVREAAFFQTTVAASGYAPLRYADFIIIFNAIGDRCNDAM